MGHVPQMLIQQQTIEDNNRQGNALRDPQDNVGQQTTNATFQDQANPH